MTEPVYEIRVFINRRFVMTAQLDGLVPLTLVVEAFIPPGHETLPPGGQPIELWVKGGQWDDWTLLRTRNVDEGEEPSGPQLKESRRLGR